MGHYPATACAIARTHRRLSEHPVHGRGGSRVRGTKRERGNRLGWSREKFLGKRSSSLKIAAASCAHVYVYARIVRWVEEEEDRVSPLGIDLARRGTVALPSLVYLSSLVSSRALSYDRPHPNPPAKIRRGIARARARIRSVHLPPEFPFGDWRWLADGVSGRRWAARLSAAVTADSLWDAIVRNHRDASGARPDCDTTLWVGYSLPTRTNEPCYSIKLYLLQEFKVSVRESVNFIPFKEDEEARVRELGVELKCKIRHNWKRIISRRET